MFTKVPSSFWKISCVLFTSIVAPLGIKHLDDSGREIPPAETVAACPQEPLGSNSIRIIAKGSGGTPEVAFQNAIDTALRQAVEAEVSAISWRDHSHAYLASLRQNGNGVLLGWHEVSSTSDRHITGRLYHSEVAVEVNLEVLREHLKAVALTFKP